MQRVAERAQLLKLQEYVPDRANQSTAVRDIHRMGYRKFETASLATFNKKMSEYKMGREYENEEVDELPSPDFAEDNDPDELELDA